MVQGELKIEANPVAEREVDVGVEVDEPSGVVEGDQSGGQAGKCGWLKTRSMMIGISVVCACVIAGAMFGILWGSTGSSDSSDEASFQEFNYYHNRVYASRRSSEYELRFENFKRHLQQVKDRNAGRRSDSEKHGITKYADWHQEELDTLAFHTKGSGTATITGITGSRRDDTQETFHEVTPGTKTSEISSRRGCTDIYSNCPQVAAMTGYCQYGTFSTGQTISSACCASCSGSSAPSPPSCYDKYSNCATLGATYDDCQMQLNGGEKCSAACCTTCSSRTQAPTPPPTTIGAPPCNIVRHSSKEIRNQGQCGNCWTFSTAETIRFNYIQQHGTDPGQLSSQFITDCMRTTTCSGGVNGCCGGDPQSAMDWVKAQGGIPTAEVYGDFFTGGTCETTTSSSGGGSVVSTSKGNTMSGNCPTTAFACSSVTKAATVSSTTTVASEYDMGQHVCNTGSLSIAVATAGWNTYVSGVLSPSTCGTSVDHAVVAVGLDIDQNAWVVRNQWGNSWGATKSGTQLDATSQYASYCSVVLDPGTSHTCSSTVYGSSTTFQEACPETCAAKANGDTLGYILLKYGENTCSLDGAAVYATTATV
eukprot:TRINITY_DN14532_c0_g10_i1.p1 TRINITY_DN14532_c0_g10~~TRINITY_DN14532_c0_g10_i1.p1  ORF type:complete len:593 (+),score=145.04 TRINITY_DN14532_c0_g10_i1:99-1877(+)